jgi:transcriptional/translational regulatory protein YebC/TACO1
MFGYGGEIYISRSGVDIQKLEEYILELPILDYILGENDDDICIYTERSEYAHVLSEISKNGYIVNKSGVAYTAKTHTEIIDFDKALKIYTMLEALDADEDVENVWNNADIADALWAEVAKKVEASKFRT